MADCTVYPRPRHVRRRRTVVRVGDELLTAPRIFINVGGRAVVPDMPGIDDVPYLTNTTILALDHLPRASGRRRRQLHRPRVRADVSPLRREVTVVEMAPRLIGREDEDVSQAIEGILEARRHHGPHERDVHRLAPHAEGVGGSRRLHAKATRKSIGSHVLLAVGRRPNTDDLGLDNGWRRDRRARLHHRRRLLWPPTSPASGRSATATAAARSRTPPTTTSRSSRPTCSTASTAA